MRARLLGAVVLTVAAILGCGKGQPQSGTASSAEKGQKPAAEDYAAARARFRTKLTRHGPCPGEGGTQPYRDLKRPAEVQEVEYRSGELALKAWFQAPSPATGKLPAVLFLHGGWGFDEDDWKHTQPFRDAGYAVLAPALRAEDCLPGAFTMFYDEVDDVLAAAEALAGMPQVDQQRLYLAGYSAGGTLTMLATMASGRFRAAAALDGSPDRRTFARGFSKEVPFERDNPEEYRMRSPIDFPGSFKCPIRLYCSQEANGYIEETQRLTCWAQAKGLDVEMVTVRGDHGTFRLPASRLAIEFFRQR